MVGRGVTRAAVMAVLALVAGSASGCARPPLDATPEGAVRLWVERMEDTAVDPKASRDAYALLAAPARKNLEARAERSARVLGRRVPPEEMLAAGRFGLRFRPRVYRAVINGDHANVDVRGDHEAERAMIACVKEPSGWRLDVELPEAAPIPTRMDGGI